MVRSRFSVSVCVFVSTFAWLLGPSVSLAAQRPNVVFILIDDLGWADVGCFGSTFYETPNIDRLADHGMRFTQAYAACPVCSPTRASIMTGKSPARLKLTNFLKGQRNRSGSPILTAQYADELPLEEVTLAESLKSQGYRTCFIGKWHLGGEAYYPEHQGFDINIGGTHAGSPKSYFWPRWTGRPPIEGRSEGDYLPDRLAAEACAFLEAQAKRDEPFLLYLSHYTVHIPIEGKPDKIARYRAKLEANPSQQGGQNNPHYAAMVESMDESVGRVLDTLDRHGLTEKTLVVFFSDNGGLSTPEGKHTPATSNAPLRAGKGYLYEGGIREPLIVSWPGRIPAGTVCETPVISNDFFPTLRELCGVPAEAVPPRGAIDGISLVPLLENPSATLTRSEFFWHYPHFSNQGGRPGGAIRAGDWKLIERYEFGELELYNLADDPGETMNLTESFPDRARELQERLAAWRAEVHASMPPRNPDYRAP